jgi:hypothetical protein
VGDSSNKSPQTPNQPGPVPQLWYIWMIWMKTSEDFWQTGYAYSWSCRVTWVWSDLSPTIPTPLLRSDIAESSGPVLYQWYIIHRKTSEKITANWICTGSCWVRRWQKSRSCQTDLDRMTPVRKLICYQLTYPQSIPDFIFPNLLESESLSMFKTITLLTEHAMSFRQEVWRYSLLFTHVIPS